MAFKLKSGNTTSFKLMGGTDKSPAKHRLTKRVPNKVDFDRLPKSYPRDHAVEIKHDHPKDDKKGDSIKTEQGGVVISDGVKKKSAKKVVKKILEKGFVPTKGATTDGSPAKQRVSDLPKNFNTKGSAGSTTPGYKSTKAAKAKSKLPKNFNTKGGKTTTPGYSTTKAAKTQNFRNAANKIKTVSSKTNKGSKVVNAFKNTPKQMRKTGKKVMKKTATKVASRFAGLAGLALTAYDVGKFGNDVRKGMKHHSFDDSIEKAWDKNKWWGPKEGNILKGNDRKKGEIKAIDLIKKAKTKKK